MQSYLYDITLTKYALLNFFLNNFPNIISHNLNLDLKGLWKNIFLLVRFKMIYKKNILSW